MRWRPLSFLPGGRFTRRLSWIAGGMLVGQLLLVATMPLLTRLYSPETFGIFGVFAAFVGILGSIMSGRYEFAIPLAAQDKEAAALVVAGTLVTCFLTTLAFLVVWAFGEPLEGATSMPGLASLLWLLPPILFLTGIGQPLEYWSIRRDTLRLNAATRVAQYGGQAISQAALGFSGTGAIGLVIGYGLGYVIRAALFVAKITRRDRRIFATTRLTEVREVAWSMRRYPLLTTFASVVKSLTQFLPTILFAAFFGPAVAGGFDLAQRILTVPVRLVSGAASQVFLAEASQHSVADLLNLFKKTVSRFLLLGIVGMLPILVAGPFLFAFVFGEPWREAGTFAQALVVLQLARFVQVPTSQSFNILGRQDLELKTAILGAISLAGSFGIIALLDIGPIGALLLYSVASGATNLIMLYVAWHTIRKAAIRESHKSAS
jgi:O-antigen/teichoic acid export membrane protein